MNGIDDQSGGWLPAGGRQQLYPQCSFNLAKNNDWETTFSDGYGRYEDTLIVSDLHQASDYANTDGCIAKSII